MEQKKLYFLALWLEEDIVGGLILILRYGEYLQLIFFKAVSFATGFSEIWKVELVDGEDCSKGLHDVILKEGIEL